MKPFSLDVKPPPIAIDFLNKCFIRLNRFSAFNEKKNGNVCIYHKNCIDGMSGYYFVYVAFNGLIKGIGEEYKESIDSYRDTRPDVTGKNVVLVDFSYPREILLEMAAEARNILILDHHKTAQNALVDLPVNVKCVFDTSRCGSRIAFEYFWPKEQNPRLLQYIEDRDLGKWDHTYTDVINAAIWSYSQDIENWEILFNTDTSVLIEQGNIIHHRQSRDINRLIQTGRRNITIGPYTVPAINAPFFYTTEIGRRLLTTKDLPFAPFVVIYSIQSDFVVVSLRSTDNGVDVEKIARYFGGGGHRNAAGFKLPITQFFTSNTLCLEYPEK